MSIKEVKTDSTGETGVTPRLVRIVTDDTLATVTTAGYLNQAVAQGFLFNETDLCAVVTKTSPGAPASQVGWFEVSKSGDDWSLTGTGEPGEVVLPTLPGHIAHFVDPQGKLSSQPLATVVHDGNIQAGGNLAGGALVSSSTLGGGYVSLSAQNFTTEGTIIQNSNVPSPRFITIPDPGTTSADFILSQSASGQTISTGSFTVAAGAIQSGSDGNQGAVTIFPATANQGAFGMFANDNATGDFVYQIRNATAYGQDTTVTFPDPGTPTATVMLSPVPAPIPNSNLQYIDRGVSFGDLAGAGVVTVILGIPGESFRIREIYLNSGGTAFSGGGGDREIRIYDTGGNYSVIPAAGLVGTVNARWGDTELPFPASRPIFAATAPGAALEIAYSGGTADYTSGDLILTFAIELIP